MNNLQGLNKRILVVIPHFFNAGQYESSYFGSHQTQSRSFRKKIVEKCRKSLLSEIELSRLNYEIVYLGIKGCNLVDLQVEVSPNDPRHLPWIAFDYAFTQADKFDFVMVLEDDLELNDGTLNPLLKFNSSIDQNETLIPNRIEIFDGFPYCTDLIAMPGWKSSSIDYENFRLREPINIHSGFLLLGSGRFKRAYEERPFDVPVQIIGDFMASAFANMHAFQKIYRTVPTTTGVTVQHNDSWAKRMIEYGILGEKDVLARINLSEKE